MPGDLIFYGLMALIFVGIILASSRARRARQGTGSGSGSPTPDHNRSPSNDSRDTGGDSGDA